MLTDFARRTWLNFAPCDLFCFTIRLHWTMDGTLEECNPALLDYTVALLREGYVCIENRPSILPQLITQTNPEIIMWRSQAPHHFTKKRLRGINCLIQRVSLGSGARRYRERDMISEALATKRFVLSIKKRGTRTSFLVQRKELQDRSFSVRSATAEWEMGSLCMCFLWLTRLC